MSTIRRAQPDPSGSSSDLLASSRRVARPEWGQASGARGSEQVRLTAENSDSGPGPRPPLLGRSREMQAAG